MGSRRNVPPAYDERLHRGPLPHPHHPREQIPLAVILEDKLASQAAEIERLTRDNHTLASSHVALTQDLAAAKREADKVRENTRSIQNEGVIEIRILLDKIAKLEANVRAGESLKKELEKARDEARDLETEKLELVAGIQQGNIELENAQANVRKLPEMQTQLEDSRKENERLRRSKTFEYEKGLNTKKVEELKIMEKDLIALVEEVERLQAELINAETMVPISQTPYTNSDNSYPPMLHGNSSYPDTSGGPLLQTIHGPNPYAAV